MKEGRFAVIDLGTNTFNITVVEIDNHVMQELYHDRISVRIGQGGIGNNIITDEACQRALDAVQAFQEVLEKLDVPDDNIRAIATSAFRNAQNGEALAKNIFIATEIPIQIIQGDQEAEWIYEGVRAALEIGEHPALIMDIGGGSIEFVIGNSHEIFWKKSYELGAQRLYDMFHTQDPIEPQKLNELLVYIHHKLHVLEEAIKVYSPTTLIGSSGSFDTLFDMYMAAYNLDIDLDNCTEFELPIPFFHTIYNTLVTKDVTERLTIPGMSKIRVDMIVVAAALIQAVLQMHAFEKMRISTYALKEGVLQKLIGHSIY